jgi:hypothetical protein
VLKTALLGAAAVRALAGGPNSARMRATTDDAANAAVDANGSVLTVKPPLCLPAVSA